MSQSLLSRRPFRFFAAVRWLKWGECLEIPVAYASATAGRSLHHWPFRPWADDGAIRRFHWEGAERRSNDHGGANHHHASKLSVRLGGDLGLWWPGVWRLVRLPRVQKKVTYSECDRCSDLRQVFRAISCLRSDHLERWRSSRKWIGSKPMTHRL